MGKTRDRTEQPGATQRGHAKSIRFDEADLKRLRQLAERWQCSEDEAVRRVVLHASRSTVSHEELRRAAERAQKYYATDPDALAWADVVGDDPDEEGRGLAGDVRPDAGGTVMGRRALTLVLESIKTLEPEELQQVQQAVQARMGQKRYPPEEERFLQALLDAGVIREIKPPRSTPVGDRRRIQASGKPVSETLVEERR